MKNRSEAIERYALASLERSAFRDFVCVVWDASDDDRTRRAAEDGAGMQIKKIGKPTHAGNLYQFSLEFDSIEQVFTSYITGDAKIGRAHV